MKKETKCDLTNYENIDLYSITKEEVSNTVSEFDSIKKIDEDGNEYWSARDMCKALEYSQWRNFKNAIEKAKEQINNAGGNAEEHIGLLESATQTGKGRIQEIEDYKLDRYGAYSVVNNTDPSKKKAALAKDYLTINARKGEVLSEKINNKIEWAKEIDARDHLKMANKDLSVACLEHGVEQNEMGIVMDAGDRGMFDKTTKQLKEDNNIPNDRPTADFFGEDMSLFKAAAQKLAKAEIEINNLNGVNECADATYDSNKQISELIEKKFQKKPEELITKNDVKLTEKKFNKLTKEQQKIIEQFA